MYVGNANRASQEAVITPDNMEPIEGDIQQEPFLSQKQMAEKLSLNQNTLKYYMKKLREKGIIERAGSSRKGKWIVKRENL